ncbi:hypothetical protein D9757_013880 [Collybiopsis confluens]|uniref:Uncharacterized protein n=1 Tax=Collybiopsis confluens TaxID=2823264 RepID=A0A8H5FNT0_9AGAR|nr:hypothetical protein D9757_013880 [Collybiopsis confluens]
MAAALFERSKYFQPCDIDIKGILGGSTISRQPVTSFLPDLPIPSPIWTFTNGTNVSMIRQEYHDGLNAIIKWVQRAAKSAVLTKKPVDIPFTLTKTLHEDLQDYPNPFIDNENLYAEAGLIVVGLAVSEIWLGGHYNNYDVIITRLQNVGV